MFTGERVGGMFAGQRVGKACLLDRGLVKHVCWTEGW